MTFADLEAVAQGRVWTGEQALERGLVDQLGGLDLAVQTAADLAGVSGKVTIERYPERLGFVDQLVKEMRDPDAALPSAQQLPSAAPVRSIMQAAIVLDEVLSEDGVAAILPGHLLIR
jgi:protease-4